jgi:pyruvate/2-oxoglutarate/acetoin dehydrogenase E1 component
MAEYFEALTKAMTDLAEDERTIFIGQSVAFPGQRAHQTFAGVPMERRIEMPICEDFTIGFATGLALDGRVPVVFIPRWDFLILASNQIVNHLDKIANSNGFQAKVIIRTSVGAARPLNPGEQHVGNYGLSFERMLKRVAVLDCLTPEQVADSYRVALASKYPSIVVEYMERY